MDLLSKEVELPIVMPLSFGIIGSSSYSSSVTSQKLPLPDVIVEQIKTPKGASGEKASPSPPKFPPAQLEQKNSAGHRTSRGIKDGLSCRE